MYACRKLHWWSWMSSLWATWIACMSWGEHDVSVLSLEMWTINVGRHQMQP